MFKTTGEKGGAPETIIGASVKVEGDFVGEGNVTVQGEVIGTLETKGDILIQEGARVEAEIQANNIVSSGTIDGNVKVSQKIELSSTASVKGNIQADILSVESGAKLQGQVNIGFIEKQEKLDTKQKEK